MKSRQARAQLWAKMTQNDQKSPNRRRSFAQFSAKSQNDQKRPGIVKKDEKYRNDPKWPARFMAGAGPHTGFV